MNIYTDGACKENIRVNGDACGTGGWAFVILDQAPGCNMEVVMSDSGYVEGTTNQEMEIIAVAQAFEALKYKRPKYEMQSEGKIILYSDSAYVINCLKDKWWVRWENNGWLNSKNKPVENRDAWERVLCAIKGLDVTFFHVRRNSTRYIQMVDGMAKTASKRGTIQEL